MNFESKVFRDGTGGIPHQVVDCQFHQTTVGLGAVDHPENTIHKRHILRDYLRVSAVTVVAIKVHIHQCGGVDAG
jgi:hypothetical protein